MEARAAALEDAALGMRAHGFSYAEIAVKLGTTVEKVGRAINRAMKRHRKNAAESCEHLVTLEEIRLDEMYCTVYPMIKAGSIEAIALGLKIMDRRAKLRGLDAPAKVQAVAPDSAVPLGGLTLAQLRELDALLSNAQPAEFSEDEDPEYLAGASFPEDREAAGPSAIAPARPRQSNPLDDRL
jgi:DNA-binding CsgD family transcriptional regulator